MDDKDVIEKSQSVSNSGRKPWFKRKRFIIPIALLLIAGLGNATNQSAIDQSNQASNSKTSQEIASGDSVTEPDPAMSEEPVASEEPAVEETAVPSETISQMNAVSAASDYLAYMSFSRSGLIKQLKYEGYSTADATYAADAVGADWNEQAAGAAKDYLDTMPFSRSGLIEQLMFDGFSRSQATYGVNSVGL